MPKVKFVPQNIELEIGTTESVLSLAQKNDIHIQSVCKGIPSCAECRVRIVEGEHHVIPPSSKEIELIGTAHYIDHSRLSCQLRCYGDVVVDLTEQVAKENRVTKKVRGPQKKDPKESQAILGNIIEEYHEDDDKQFVKEFDSSMRTDKDGFYEDFKKNRSNNSQPNRQNQQQGGGQNNQRRHPNRGGHSQPQQGQGNSSRNERGNRSENRPDGRNDRSNQSRPNNQQHRDRQGRHQQSNDNANNSNPNRKN